jgi:hypothetical protein
LVPPGGGIDRADLANSLHGSRKAVRRLWSLYDLLPRVVHPDAGAFMILAQAEVRSPRCVHDAASNIGQPRQPTVIASG